MQLMLLGFATAAACCVFAMITDGSHSLHLAHPTNPPWAPLNPLQFGASPFLICLRVLFAVACENCETRRTCNAMRCHVRCPMSGSLCMGPICHPKNPLTNEQHQQGCHMLRCCRPYAHLFRTAQMPSLSRHQKHLCKCLRAIIKLDLAADSDSGLD